MQLYCRQAMRASWPLLLTACKSLLGFQDVGLLTALIAISLVAIPTYARLARGSVLSIREQEHVTAAYSIGVKSTPDSVPRHSARRSGCVDCAGHVGYRHSHSGYSSTVLSRLGRTTANTGMGRNGGGGAKSDFHRAISHHFPGYGHCPHSFGF